jgi:hypothetical protein
MTVFISQSGLARKLSLAQATLARRLRARGVIADGILIQGGKEPTVIFASDRLPALRATLAPAQPIEKTA